MQSGRGAAFACFIIRMCPDGSISGRPLARFCGLGARKQSGQHEASLTDAAHLKLKCAHGEHPSDYNVQGTVDLQHGLIVAEAAGPAPPTTGSN